MRRLVGVPGVVDLACRAVRSSERGRLTVWQRAFPSASTVRRDLGDGDGSEHSGSRGLLTRKGHMFKPCCAHRTGLGQGFRKRARPAERRDRRRGAVQRPQSTSLPTGGVLFRGQKACRRRRCRAGAQVRLTAGAFKMVLTPGRPKASLVRRSGPPAWGKRRPGPAAEATLVVTGHGAPVRWGVLPRCG
jgi:hypothetical protein